MLRKVLDAKVPVLCAAGVDSDHGLCTFVHTFLTLVDGVTTPPLSSDRLADLVVV